MNNLYEYLGNLNPGDEDSDGDGDLDLAAGNSSDFGGAIDRLYTNDGSGNFTGKNLSLNVRRATSVAWGDINGDGSEVLPVEELAP